MAEYIEREAALRVLCDACGNAACPKGLIPRCSYYEKMQSIPAADVVERASGIIGVIPAADVRPVVRGKWSVHEIYKHELSYGATAYEPVYECSACGGWMESYLRYDEPIMPEDADFPRFCPNCGADMREEQT